MLATKNIFVNLPVKDLSKTKEFFSRVGFGFNAQFSSEQAACMVISENIYAMLLTKDFFQSFIQSTKKEIADATKHTEVIMALSAESREEVNVLVNRALEAGATHYTEPVDHGFMYSWSFQDLDGHLWEIMYMDQNHIQQYKKNSTAAAMDQVIRTCAVLFLFIIMPGTPACCGSSADAPFCPE